ncbi:ABC transporter permease [Ruminococcus sp. 5_1_39BFAA]|uniref:ABC transporter permease n=1 Tax=Ruminococcus sp. 5_1_39BFAA TaxID=457412 RepID=UPI00356A2E02
MKKRVSKRLVMYEIRNILGNPFIPFFGMAFPLIMLFVIAKAAAQETPESMISQVNTAVFISISMIIPMAVLLIGYAANYSLELEKGIPMRMKLFGFEENTILAAKIVAQLLVVTVGLVIYTAVSYALLDMDIPKIWPAVCLILCLYILSLIFIVFSHGVANLMRKFGPTYAVTMGLYFGIMILCGMMGIKTDQLPGILRKIAYMLPMTYIGNDFITFWQGGSYNFAPLIQAFLLLGAVSGIILLLSRRKRG